jgi:uncharacterized membrane protein
MSIRSTTVFVLILIIAATLAGLLVWSHLPDRMASHWNIYDQVDGYTSRFWGVFLMPLISLVMFLLFLLIPNIDPLKANITKFRETFNLFIVLIVAFMVYMYALTLLWNLGYTGFHMSTAMLPAMGLLFIFVGYMLRKAKRNWFIGIRTPWTLSSDKVWDETHRVGSVLFIFSGALAFFGAFFPGAAAFWLILIPITVSTVFVTAYSYVLYQRETKG